MRRLSLLGIAGAVLLGVSTTLAACGSAPAPTAKPTPAPTAKPTPAPTAKPGWEAINGLFFKTQALAAHQISVLAAQGFMGYGTEVETSMVYEVEKEFATQTLAAAEVARLKTAKFPAAVESSPGTN
jgi:hypothetical protein